MADVRAEYLDGWHAHKGGWAVSGNPYDEKSQPFSHQCWLSGWCDRFGAVKHGKSLDLDSEVHD